MNRRLALLLLSTALPVASALAQPADWPLPIDISDTNAKIHFSVDSTWHLVTGTATHITGRAWRESSEDAAPIRAEVSVPVAAFDTDSSRRDERMREVMSEQTYPRVRFVLSDIADLCPPAAITAEHPCTPTLRGEMQIRDVRRPITFTSVLSKAPNGYHLSGHSSLDWRNFGVEDPSILVAKLQPIVAIDIDLDIVAQNGDR